MTNYDKIVVDACLILAKQIHSYNKEAMILKEKSSDIQKQLSISVDLPTTQNLLNDLKQLTTLLENIEERVKNINTKIKYLKSIDK